MEIYDEFALDNLFGCQHDLQLNDFLSNSTDSPLDLCFPELSTPDFESYFQPATPPAVQEEPCLVKKLEQAPVQYYHYPSLPCSIQSYVPMSSPRTSSPPPISPPPISSPRIYSPPPISSLPQSQFTSYHHAPMFPVGLTEQYVFYPQPQIDPQVSIIARSSPLRDVSRAFSTAKYSEIFNQHANSLLVEKHPQLTEVDLRRIERTGLLYFMKNVKVIVPRIGPWKFLSHVRSDENLIERSFNLEGFPIRCKVKEWVINGDLWRMYHFIKGTVPKKRQLYINFKNKHVLQKKLS